MSTFEFTITETFEMVELQEYLDYITLERTSELEEKMICKNTDYQKIHAEIDDFYQKLQQKTMELSRQEVIIDNLHLAVGSLEKLIQKLVYQQGLKDGAKLKNILDSK